MRPPPQTESTAPARQQKKPPFRKRGVGGIYTYIYTYTYTHQAASPRNTPPRRLPSFRRRPESRTPVSPVACANPDIPGPPSARTFPPPPPSFPRKRESTPGHTTRRGMMTAGLRRHGLMQQRPGVVMPGRGARPCAPTFVGRQRHTAAPTSLPYPAHPRRHSSSNAAPAVIPAQAGIQNPGKPRPHQKANETAPPPTVIPAKAGIHPPAQSPAGAHRGSGFRSAPE